MEGEVTSTSASMETQQHNEQEYPLHLIISQMMFAYGDCEKPLGICQEFMLDLVHGQLKILIDKAHKLSIERRPSVGFPEFMFAFRRHPLLIRKLINYMRLVDLMSSMFRQVYNQQTIGNSDEVLPLPNTPYLIMQNSLNDLQKLKNTSRVIAAVRLIDVMGHLLADIDEHSLSASKMERLRRMEERTKQMETEMSADSAAKFLQWVEAPPVEKGVVDALNFCATEIVAIITESAVLCRDEENNRNTEKRADDQLLKPLFIRHYEKAVLRNRGYAKRKDILFGYF